MTTNLEYYKVFYYVAVCQSMTLAAERLMISQPAVSQSMRQLEKALDTKLIVRCPAGMAPPDPRREKYCFPISNRDMKKCSRGNRCFPN